MASKVPRSISYPPNTAPFGEMHLRRHSIDEQLVRVSGPVPKLTLAAARLLQQQLLETDWVNEAIKSAGLSGPKGPGLVPATVGLGRGLYHAFYRPEEAAAWYATKGEFDGTTYGDELGLSGVGVLRCADQRSRLARAVAERLRPDKVGPEVTNVETFSTSPDLNIALLDAGIRYYLAVRPDGPIATQSFVPDGAKWATLARLGFGVIGDHMRQDVIAGLGLEEELMVATSAREVQGRITEQYRWVAGAEIS